MADQWSVVSQAPAATTPSGDEWGVVSQEAADPHSVGGVLGNVASSGANLVGGMGHALMHPIDTATNLATAVAGASPVSAPAGSWQHDVAQPAANAVGDFYKQRYGGLKNIGETAYHDPLGLAADISAIAGGADVGMRAGGALADAAGASGAADALRTGANTAKAVSTYGNPVSAAGKGIGALGSKALKIRSGLSPVEQAAVDYALNDSDLSGSVDAATASGNKAVQSAKSLLRKSPMSAGTVGDAELSQQGAIAGKMGDISDAVAPGGAKTKSTAGVSVQQKIAAKLNDYSGAARTAYQSLIQRAKANPEMVQVGTEPTMEYAPGADIPPDAPEIPTRPVMKPVAGATSTAAVKAAAAPILDEIMKTIPEAQRQMSPSVSLLKQIMARPAYVDIETAINDNSALQNLARTETPQLRTQAQRISSALSSPYRDAIDQAATKLGPDAMQMLQDGRQATINKYELGKAVPKQTAQNPVNLANYLTAGDGKAVPVLQTLQKHIPDAIPDVARATVENIFGHTTAKGGVSRVPGALAKWNKLGSETRQILFGKDVSEEITNLLNYASMATGEMNPSGTAGVGQIAGLTALLLKDPMSAIAAMAGSRAMAKAMFNPDVAAAVRQTGRVPLPQPGRMARIAGAPLNPKVVNTGRMINAPTDQQ